MNNLSSIDKYYTDEIIKRNEIAMRIAKKHGLKTDDLFTFMYNFPHRDFVHFTKEAIQDMAKQVAKAINVDLI